MNVHLYGLLDYCTNFFKFAMVVFMAPVASTIPPNFKGPNLRKAELAP